MKLFLTNITPISADASPLFDSMIQLPDYIDLVVGDTAQLYYNAMQVSPYFYQYRLTCDIGSDLLRYYEITPTVAGDYAFKIELMNSDYTVETSKTCTIRVKEAVQQPATTHNFWTVGDSLVNNPTWTDEMVRRLTGIGGTPIGNEFGNIVNHREGNSGKTWDWYVNDEESPFVYSGVLDFEQYRIDNALAIPQSMYILLTWNGMGSSRTQAQWDAWDNDVYSFINGVKSAFPSCDIKLMSPQIPSLNGGLGAGYPTLGAYYSDVFLQIINSKKQAQIYQRICTESGYENCNHLETGLQVDSLWNMPYANKNVNTRNSAEQEPIGNNGVHPDTKGYYQIADAGYRDFINNYCQ